MESNQTSGPQSELFRRDVLDHQNRRLIGEISLAQPLSLKCWLITGVCSLIVILTFLFSTEVYRKERVFGVLSPSKGVLHVLASRTGTIAEVLVQEGSQVSKGQPLLVLVNRQGGEANALAPLLIEQLEVRLTLARESIKSHERLLDEELASQTALGVELKQKRHQLNRQRELLQARIELQRHWLETRVALVERGDLAALALSQDRDALLSLQQSQVELEQALMDIDQQRRMSADQFRLLPIRYRDNIRRFREQASELRQKIDEVNSTFHVVVRAAEDGKVTAVQVARGQQVVAGSRLLSMVPQGSILLADLSLPTSSAGMVRVGQN